MKFPGLSLLFIGATSSVQSTLAFVAPTSKAAKMTQRNLFKGFFGTAAGTSEYPVYAEESVMSQKAHGTSEKPVQKDLRWACDFETADRICNFNRHYAEYSGYWESTTFLNDVQQNIEEGTPVTFYDSGWKGSPLFRAPMDRTWEDFLEESTKHGWPSFRDSEVDWEYARVLPGGEMVSIDGTHLGHNLPDKKGNRYCISK